MTSSDVGSALRSARQARRLSLSDVAGEAGLSVATLSRIETGKQNVDVKLLVVLAEILRVPPASLLGDGPARQPNARLAEELAILSPAERARVLVAAMKQSRPEAGREALHARVESLLTALDLIRDELLHLRKTIRRGK